MSVSVCLSIRVFVCLSVGGPIPGTTRPVFTKLLHVLPMAAAFSGCVAIHYVLPVS